MQLPPETSGRKHLARSTAWRAGPDFSSYRPPFHRSASAPSGRLLFLEQFGATDVIQTLPKVSMALQAGVTGDKPDDED
jgi:hypothetical protein